MKSKKMEVEYLKSELRKRDERIQTLECMLNEARVFSQNGEDGITYLIFEKIKPTNSYYVEFGTEDGSQCNTRILREFANFTGLLMDGDNENSYINLQKEFITAENIIELFEKYNVPQKFDFLSVDLDFNDWYIVKNILQAFYRPRVVVVEYNGFHGPNEDKIIAYNPTARWDGTNYASASLLAYFRLFRMFGYSLIYCERKGINAFFILDELVPSLGGTFPFVNEIEKIYKVSASKDTICKDPLNRPYVSSTDLL